MKRVCDGLENVLVAPSPGVDEKGACLTEIMVLVRRCLELRAPTPQGNGSKDIRVMKSATKHTYLGRHDDGREEAGGI